MNLTRLAGIAEALDALAVAGGECDASALGPDELMAVNRAFGALRRQVDVAYTSVAAEIARQSRRELGRDSLARKQGFASPASLISATSGSTIGDAVKVMRVAEATQPRVSLTGEELPARHPHVAAALRRGDIGVTASDDITKMLERVALRAEPGALDAAEKILVDCAPGLTPDQLHKAIARAEAGLDPDGLEPTEQKLRDGRYLFVREERDGSISIKGSLDPVSGAPVMALFTGLTTHAVRTRGRGATPSAEGGAESARQGAPDDRAATPFRGEAALADGADAPDAVPAADERSRTQIQADALVDICRHALGCDRVATGPVATLIVRMGLDQLESRSGAIEIDGLDRPVSAGAARRLAADAQVIPHVLGSASETLDWGRATRLFTPIQKLALAERDGGCAFCGAPPAMCSAHHIAWWHRDHGRTDLADGVLLCTGCHHRVHDDGWDIRVEGRGVAARVWFIPPPWLDRDRTPRRAFSSRFGLAA